MKAIRFAAPIPTYLATLVAGKLSHQLYLGPHACTRYGDVPPPALPGDRWVRVRTRLGGICGSDLNIITLKASPSTSPFSSFPFVLGHENVGDVVEVGRGVRGISPGDRVTGNPLLACAVRGIDPPCAACASGEPQRCVHFTDGALAPGMLLGTTRDLGGSWGDEFVMHETQIVPVPDALGDAEAVLIEPFACSVHAVRANLPEPNARVLVVGGGSIGLLTVAALHSLAPDATVTLLARHAFQSAHALRLGASEVVTARGDYQSALADAAKTRLLQPIIGKRVGVGGFDQTFVCVGTTQAMEDAMCVTRAGGMIVLLGNATMMNRLDWTPLWLKELTVKGSLCYGGHRHGAPASGAFEEAARLVSRGCAPIGPLLTHTFPIADYREAIATAMGKSETESVKVAFRF